MIATHSINVLEDKRQITLEKLIFNTNDKAQFTSILKFYYMSSISDVIEIASALLSFFMPVTYIMSTYNLDLSKVGLGTIEFIVCILLIVDFFWRMYLSESRLYFLVKLSAIIDYTSIVPVLIGNMLQSTSRIVCYMKTIRIVCCLRLENFFSRHKLTIMKRAFNLLIMVLSLIVIMGGAMIEIENNAYFSNISIGPNIPEGKIKLKVLQFHDIVYFTIVTIGTLGYGDVVPNNDLSKVIVFFEILMVIILLPTSTNNLLEALKANSKYNNQLYEEQHKKHILLLGFFNAETLKNFLEEFYNPDHGNTSIDTVILHHDPPTDDILVLLRQQAYASKVFYLQGDPLDIDSLKRAQAHMSICVIILSRKSQSSDCINEDYKIMQWALSIKAYSKIFKNQMTRVCLQVNLSANRQLYKFVSSKQSQILDHVSCTEELKLKMIAKNCVCPGIITLISALLTSSIPNYKISYPTELTNKNKYLAVLWGMQCEIYRVILKGDTFGGLVFSEVVRVLYQEKRLMLFAIEVDVFDEIRVFVNPSEYLLEYKNYYAYVIDKQMPNINYINDINIEQLPRVNFCKAREINKANDVVIHRKILNAKSSGNYLASNYAHRSQPIPFNAAKNEAFMKIRLKKHIIICGFIKDIDILITTLRPKIFGDKITPIVILTNDRRIKKEWDKIRTYEDVFVIKGSALNIFDLKRARIKTAHVAVILPKKEEESSSSTNGSFDQESETIFIYKTIKNINPYIRITTEIKDICNINFLLGVKDESYLRRYGFWATDPIAYGELYLPYFLDTITCQSIYNPFIEQIIEQFITGSANTFHMETELFNKKGLFECSIFLYNPPYEIRKLKNYSDIYIELVKQYKMISLAIFKKLEKESKPVLIINPPENEIVCKYDQLFVLHTHEPTTTKGVRHDSSSLSTNSIVPDDLNDKKVIAKRNIAALAQIKSEVKKLSSRLEYIESSLAGQHPNQDTLT